MATRLLNMATLGLALLLALAATAEAGPKKPPNNDFILRAPATEIADIAFRNGLQVLDEVDASADALGRSVYLVRAPLGLTAEEVLLDVGELEPEALNIEEVYLASLPELEQSTMALLDQSVMALLDSFDDTTSVEFDKDAAGEKRFVWTPYVNQPAAQILRVSEAQDGEGGDALVAIIDTGVDPSHPLFAHRLVPGYDFVNELPGVASEWTGLDQSVMALLDQSTMALLDQSTMALLDGAEFAQVNQSVMALLDQSVMALLDGNLPPAFGHGTMVAGVVHRVAPKARLMPLKAFDADGNGSLFDIVRAIYYAVDHGANVINMSFSVEVFSPELMRAVNYAARRGVTCVASAGNRGIQTMVYPAALGNVVGVASTTNDDYLSAFSNQGIDLVSVAAPGEAVLTTFPGGGWAVASGTSFAAPWIAGAAAIFADKNGHENGPQATDYYLASSALSFALPVHGADSGAAGYGRADLKEARDRLDSP